MDAKMSKNGKQKSQNRRKYSKSVKKQISV